VKVLKAFDDGVELLDRGGFDISNGRATNLTKASWMLLVFFDSKHDVEIGEGDGFSLFDSGDLSPVRAKPFFFRGCNGIMLVLFLTGFCN
jgi:hypothetical protein